MSNSNKKPWEHGSVINLEASRVVQALSECINEIHKLQSENSRLQNRLDDLQEQLDEFISR